MPKILATIVLTCLNEADLASQSIEEIKRELSGTVVEASFILVDDGSQEKAVLKLTEIAKKLGAKIILHEKNEGRGKSVADGIRASGTDIVGFIDTDLEIPARYIFPFVRAIDQGSDVACALRYYDFRLRDIVRVILSRGDVTLMRIVLSSRLQDTES